PNGDASVAVDVERVNMKMSAGALKSWDGEVLDNYVVGSLRWRGIRLADSVPLPSTQSPIWLAPRGVRSAGVVMPSGQGERYLFYRGVAHLDALVQTERTSTDVRLKSPARMLWLREPSMTIPALWLVSVRADGQVAFRRHEQLTIARDSA